MFRAISMFQPTTRRVRMQRVAGCSAMAQRRGFFLSSPIVAHAL
jgi:hypothetical protein